MWLNKLKIAIVQKDIDTLNTLMDNLPDLSDTREIDEALNLIASAKSLLIDLKDDTQISMIQIQKNINFLKSTQGPIAPKLDISF